MRDQTYPGERPPILRERDRIAAALREAGVTVTGMGVSLRDEVADVCWRSEDGHDWLAVISPLPPPSGLDLLPREGAPQDAQPPEEDDQT